MVGGPDPKMRSRRLVGCISGFLICYILVKNTTTEGGEKMRSNSLNLVEDTINESGVFELVREDIHM